jgi:hypothetical protein
MAILAIEAYQKILKSLSTIGFVLGQQKGYSGVPVQGFSDSKVKGQRNRMF